VFRERFYKFTDFHAHCADRLLTYNAHYVV